MPMDNYHSGRVKNPNDFMEGKKYWATITLKNTDGIELVTGKLKSDGADGPMTAQAYRFPKDKYTEKQAKDWLKKRKIKTVLFEPEKKEVSEMTTSMAANVGPGTPAILGFDNAWDSMTKKKKKKDLTGNPDGIIKNGTMKEQQVVATVSGDEYDNNHFDGSYESIIDQVREALLESGEYGDYPRVISTFQDVVYVGADIPAQGAGIVNAGERKYFEVEYTFDADDNVVLGNKTEIEKMTKWIIKEQAEKIALGLFPITEEILEEAKWTKAFINTLPDSSFAYVETGGEKDEEGKTVPRSLRHLPYKNESGEIDEPHLRNALARLSQTDLSDTEMKKAKSKLDKAAKDSGIGENA